MLIFFRRTVCCIVFLLCQQLVFSDVKSTNGQIKFDVENDSQSEMMLNATGLGIGTSSPSANLHVMGNAYIEDLVLGSTLEWTRGTVSSNTTLSESFSSPILFVDTASDNLTLTLPYAGNVSGKTLWIKKKSRSNLLTIQASGGNIEGQSQIYLGSLGKSFPNVQLISEDNEWWILQSDFWSPKDLNLTLWYDAMDEASLVLNAGNVSTWMDKSGQNLHVEQSTGTDQPSYSNSTVVFDGSDDYMIRDDLDAVDLTGSDRNTACCIMLLKRNAGTVYFKFEVGSTRRIGAEGASRFDFGDATAGGNNLNVWSSSLNGTDFQILALEKTPNNQNVYLTGDLVGNNPNTTPLDENNDNFNLSLGAQFNGTLNADVEFKEIIFLDNCNSTDRKKLEGYLAWKWGVFDQLPSGHPYAQSPP